jgi:hypothetical protein
MVFCLKELLPYTCHGNIQVKAGVMICLYFRIYLATLSSHFTIPSITPIEMRQNPANTAQHIHCCGKVLSIVTPRAMKRLPIAVAVSQSPWQIP